MTVHRVPACCCHSYQCWNHCFLRQFRFGPCSRLQVTLTSVYEADLQFRCNQILVRLDQGQSGITLLVVFRPPWQAGKFGFFRAEINASAFRLASKLIFSFVEMVLTAPFLPGLVCHALDRVQLVAFWLLVSLLCLSGESDVVHPRPVQHALISIPFLYHSSVKLIPLCRD